MVVAQARPPRAFQKKNWRQCMREAPANSAAQTRRKITQRPKNTVLGPCFSKKLSRMAIWRSLTCRTAP